MDWPFLLGLPGNLWGLSQPVSLIFVFSQILALENGIHKGTFYCNKGRRNIVVRAEKGDSGHIASPGYPEAYSPKSFQGSWCEVQIRACSTCKIRLKFTEIDFPSCNETLSTVTAPPTGSKCIPGCDHLFLHEVDNPYNAITENVYYDSDEGNTYVSISAHLKLSHCMANGTTDMAQKFQVSFLILDKNELRQGMVAEYGTTIGRVLSPNFPKGYALNGETFTYMIQNLDPYGHVRLTFDDWDIAPESVVKLYDGLSTKSPSVVLDRKKRPALVSDSSTLVIVFDTGVNPKGCCKYAGFKAAYQFISEKDWPDKPLTDCSRTYAMRSGGMIDFTGSMSHPGQPNFFDCVWIIKRYPGEDRPDGVMLRMREVLLGDGWLQYGKLNSLEIRQGTTSLSPIKHKYTAKNLTYAQTFYTSGQGLYIRLRGGFYSTDKLSFIFTAVKNISAGGSCPGYFEYLCQNLMCIDQELMCDGIDHCGDNSDESPALDCSVSALWRLSFKWSMPFMDVSSPGPSPRCEDGFLCASGTECLSHSKRCDGLLDCQDGSDEYGCYTPTTDHSAGVSSHPKHGLYLICVLFLLVIFLNNR
ncbi:suppressor of tumorigenicity 14 protein homolog [Haliotis asinina]|uniref:suppressor of tumorigenicity 14 protein homolog n=1 Tax=Haliotis asinina TaxID=109174 RepID=UPI003531D541